MSTYHIGVPWKKDVDWLGRVDDVITYYESNLKLKYGPAQDDRAYPVLGELCSIGCASRSYLNKKYGLHTDDAMATILSNVTMAIQDSGVVLPPEEGGWYVTLSEPYSYVVAPGFAAAWNESKLVPKP
jgi:hypothetical protein